MGLVESSTVKPVITAPDGLDYRIEKTRCVLKKFDGEWSEEWTPEQEAAQLAEVIVSEDGVIVDRWVRGESEDGPPEG
jgi:hypothetical protein